MRGKRAKRVEKQTLNAAMDRLVEIVTQEFGELDAEFAFVVDYRGTVALTSSLEAPEHIRALFLVAADASTSGPWRRIAGRHA